MFLFVILCVCFAILPYETGSSMCYLRNYLQTHFFAFCFDFCVVHISNCISNLIGGRKVFMVWFGLIYFDYTMAKISNQNQNSKIKKEKK